MFGGDPEAFLFKNNRLVSAHKLIAENKQVKKFNMGDDDNEYGSLGISRDGLALEMNLYPAGCRANFGYYFRKGLDDYTRKVLEPEGLELRFTSTVKLSQSFIDRTPPAILEMGCDPSENAYGKAPIPAFAYGEPFRYAGGHIHTSYHGTGAALREKGEESINALVRAFDLFVGLPLSIIRPIPEAFARRRVYGRAGEYRLQKHGIEYRTPGSELWMEHWLLSMALGVMRVLSDHTFPAGKLKPYATNSIHNLGKILENANWDKVRETINTGSEAGYGELQTVPRFYSPDAIFAAAKRAKELEYPHCAWKSHSKASYVNDFHSSGSWIHFSNEHLKPFVGTTIIST